MQDMSNQSDMLVEFGLVEFPFLFQSSLSRLPTTFWRQTRFKSWMFCSFLTVTLDFCPASFDNLIAVQMLGSKYLWICYVEVLSYYDSRILG